MESKIVENQVKALEAIKESGKPCSIGYVAASLGITWSTAKSLLLQMALTSKIVATETTNGFIFSVKPD